jgi:hypothetical protein
MAGLVWRGVRAGLGSLIREHLAEPTGDAGNLGDQVQFITFDDRVRTWAPSGAKRTDSETKEELLKNLQKREPSPMAGTTSMAAAIDATLKGIKTDLLRNLERVGGGISFLSPKSLVERLMLLSIPVLFLVTDGSEVDEAAIARNVEKAQAEWSSEIRAKIAAESASKPGHLAELSDGEWEELKTHVPPLVRIVTVGIGEHVNAYFLRYLSGLTGASGGLGSASGGGGDGFLLASTPGEISALAQSIPLHFSRCVHAHPHALKRNSRQQPMQMPVGALALRNIKVNIELEDGLIANTGSTNNNHTEIPSPSNNQWELLSPGA